MSAAFDGFSEGDAASVYSEGALDFPDALSAPRLSLYSSLKTWAGDGQSKSGVPVRYNSFAEPFVVTPQTPSVYDPEGIMQDAFEAASYVHHAGWDLGFDHAQASRWPESGTYESLHDYSRGLDMSCRQGDDQLFSYSSLLVN